MKKRFKTILISSVFICFSALFIQASDDYFEISKNLDIFASLYREINTNYVDDTKPGKLMKVGIDAMLNSLDPYTNYIPETKIEDFRFMTTGQYGGIGALIQKRDDDIIITETYDGFPAQKAGILIGDKIIEIDGNALAGKSTTQISEFLKGQPETEVEIKLERGFGDQIETVEMKVSRAEIQIHNVPYYSILTDDVGYIKLTGFTQTAESEFAASLKDLREQGMKYLIVDLRDNGGGLLRESVAIVNHFIPKGTPVVSTKGKLKEWDQSYKALNTPTDPDIPVVVLVNPNSASASEIVAGALQDLDRAVIIGQETFGKGLVQQTVDLSYNSKLKVTVAKYYTPSGRCIQRLDYAGRKEDGKAQAIPDSLIKEYQSLKYSRPLFDGKGVKPDIAMEDAFIHSISIGLLQDYYVFDFATKYRLENEAIDAPETFAVPDETLKSFKAFADSKEFKYTTEAEELLVDLKASVQEEKYYDALETEFSVLSQKLEEVKSDDFEKHKKEIGEILGSELVLRYHHQKGELIYSLKNDPYVEKAVSVLKDKSTYDSILQGTYKTSE